MVRFLWPLVLATHLCVAQTASTPSKDNLKYSDIEQSLVKIVVATPAGLNSVGTGFVVGNGKQIATASHVYLEAARALVETGMGAIMAYKAVRNGPKVLAPVEFLSADFQHDVALLKFDPAAFANQKPPVTLKALELDGDKPEIGEMIGFEGYFAADEYPLLSRTTVAGYTSAPPSPEQIILDLPANPGQSGSPVLSLRTGKVVGILAAFVPVILVPGSLPTHSGLSRSVEVEHLKRLIESAEVR